MTELLTAAQMRAIEEAAIASGAVTGLELMERAGLGVVDAIFAEWPELAPSTDEAAPAAGGSSALRAEREASLSRSPKYLEPKEGETRRAVVLCGPGNNGGDGFVVARLLREAGWAVEVFLYGDAGKLPPDARVNHERWCEVGEVAEITDQKSLDLHTFDVIVDAFFGIGLSRGFNVPASINFGMHSLMSDGLWWGGEIEPPYVVALDIVSELDADSGLQLDAETDWGGEMGAHLTVTFHRPKIGHYLSHGAVRSGKTVVVDIGLSQVLDQNAHNPFLRSKDLVRLVGAPTRLPFEIDLWKEALDPWSPSMHKYSHGHALILSGGVGKGGAARLAARGTLRIGAGAATIGCPPAALIENATQLNAIMLQKIPDGEALAETIADPRINALCIGPGLGLGEREASLVETALRPRPKDTVGRGSPRLATVLDADALTILSQNPTLFTKLHKDCILTPHAGEFRRLFPDIANKLDAPATKGPAYSKVDATREAAKRAGCIVLFKGPDTVIADPQGRCSINASLYERSAPWLATAGSGDVLAGFITGLLARGFAPMQAAETGAYLHTECALSFGPGLIAEDLPEELPKVFRALGIA